MAEGTRAAATAEVERGLERYGAGDLAGALAAFEAALALAPADAEVRRFVGWIRDLSAGRRVLDPGPALDAEALRAVEEALAPAATAAPVDTVSTAAAASDAEADLGGEVDSVSTEGAAAAGEVDSVSTTAADEEAERELDDEVAASGPAVLARPPTSGWLVPDTSIEEVIADAADAAAAVAIGRADGDDTPTGLFPTPTAPRGGAGSDLAPGVGDERPAAAPDNDTNPMGVRALALPAEVRPGDFDTASLTPTNVLPRTFTHALLDDDSDLPTDDDPYAELRLEPLYPAAGAGEPGDEPDEGDEGDSRAPPTNPFIRNTPVQPDDDVRFVAVEVALGRGDLEVALDAAEAALATHGGLTGDAARAHAGLLERLYLMRLGRLDRLARGGVTPARLDPRSAFLLSRLDGTLTLADALDVSGMHRLETLRVLALLLRRGALVLL